MPSQLVLLLPMLLQLALQLPQQSQSLSESADCAANVQEKTQVQATIVNVLQQCFNERPRSGLSFKLLGEKGEGIFWRNLEPKLKVTETGNLIVNEEINRDDPSLGCGRLLLCSKLITIRSYGPMTASKKLNLTIEDKNDNAPTFFPNNRQLHAVENSDGYLLPLPSLHDRDGGKNGRTVVRILSVSEAKVQSRSSIEQAESGSPKLSISGSLDREQLQNFSVVLEACDRGDQQMCSNVTVHVKVTDENDNAPQFTQSQYTAHISEGAYNGSELVVLTITATDADSPQHGTVRYSLDESRRPQCNDCIRIDSSTGDVLLVKRLSASLMQRLTFQVVAKDGDGGSSTKTARADVVINVIDINDNPPTISIEGQKQLPENNDSFVIGYVEAKDADLGDNGRVQCRLGDAGDSSSFSLELTDDSEIMVFRLAAVRSFDREVTAAARAEVVCWDQGQLPLTSTTTFVIDIVDVNEHRPVFTPTVWEGVRVLEGRVGELVAELNATDRDATATLNYSVLDGGQQFRIEGNRLLTKVALDRERERQPIVVTVAASDGQMSAEARLNVEVEDVNDNAPKFVQPLKYEIEESFGIEDNGKERRIGQLAAIDMDEAGTNNSRISFNLGEVLRRPRPDFARYSVSLDGVLTVRGVLDREASAQRLVVVRAFDHGQPPLTATATVTVEVIDLNDNPPQILRPLPGQSLNITDAYTPGTTVLRVRVYDADSCGGGQRRLAPADCVRNGSFRMRLRQRVSLFGVNSSTGDVFVLNPLTPGKHWLNLSVADAAGSGRQQEAFVQFSIRVRRRPDHLLLGANSNWTLLLVIVVASSFITVVLVVAIVLLNRRQPCYSSDSENSLAAAKGLVRSDGEQIFDPDARGHSPMMHSALKTFGHHANYDTHFRLDNGQVAAAAAAAAYQHAHFGHAGQPGPGPLLFGDFDVGSADSGHGASEEEIQSELRGHNLDANSRYHSQQPTLRNRSPGNYPNFSILEEECDKCHEHIPLKLHHHQQQQQPCSSNSNNSSTFCRQMQQSPLMPQSDPNFDSVSLHPPDYRSINRNLPPIAGSRSVTPQQQQQQFVANGGLSNCNSAAV